MSTVELLKERIPQVLEEIKLEELDFQKHKKSFLNHIKAINENYQKHGLGHIIHIRDDDTINFEGCCRSCIYHP